MLKEVLRPNAPVIRVESGANQVTRARLARVQKIAKNYLYLRDFPSNRYGPIPEEGDLVEEFVQGSPNRKPTFIVLDTEDNRRKYGLAEEVSLAS